MINGEQLQALMDLETGKISRDIYFSESIYQAELEQVFARSWLCVGHESEIPAPNDYVSQNMGEDPVIVWRGPDQKIRVMLNSCTHRGMKICRDDRGNREAFVCPYHAWTYNSLGELSHVPQEKLVFGSLDRFSLGLYSAPHVDTYGGFIFACWEEKAPTLRDFLGEELCWYIDIMVARQLGSLKVAPGQQRYRVKSNWKAAAENFAGDCYHVNQTHASSVIVGALPPFPLDADHTVAFRNGHGSLMTPDPGAKAIDEDIFAEKLGPDAIEYLRAIREKMIKEVTPLQNEVFTMGVTNLFPNFAFNDFSVFHPTAMLFWHPKGAQEMEVWESLCYDSEAPESVRRAVLRMTINEQAASGFFGQDDVANMEETTAASRGVISRRVPFDYSMGLKKTRPRVNPDLPGIYDTAINESNQRNFYAHWLKMMSEGRDPSND